MTGLLDLDSRAGRLRVVLGAYALTAVVWLAVFSPSLAEIEPLDTAATVLSFAFAGGTALLVVRLDLPVLEAGWGLLTYSFLLRLLDSLAEGPETVEALLPGTLQLVGLGVILLGFVRTTDQLRSSLAERNERLTVLNRVLRHNLSNRLNVVMGALEYARTQADDDPEVVTNGLHAAEDLHRVSEKLRTVDDVFGGSDARSDPVSVNDLVAGTVETYRSAYPDVEFTVETDPADPTTDVYGARAAIANLVENACEHNDAPTVTITVESTGAETTVTVADDGSGIPDPELKPIRERNESALSHGSGVGLWFVCWVAERSGGGVSFEYDDGQRVELRLPRVGGDGFFDWLSGSR